MSPVGRRNIIALASASVLAGMAPGAVQYLVAQVRKCYAVTCTTIDGKTVCYEKEVACPNES
jgi:hypothetical protein